MATHTPFRLRNGQVECRHSRESVSLISIWLIDLLYSLCFLTLCKGIRHIELFELHIFISQNKGFYGYGGPHCLSDLGFNLSIHVQYHLLNCSYLFACQSRQLVFSQCFPLIDISFLSSDGKSTFWLNLEKYRFIFYWFTKRGVYFVFVSKTLKSVPTSANSSELQILLAKKEQLNLLNISIRLFLLWKRFHLGFWIHVFYSNFFSPTWRQWSYCNKKFCRELLVTLL